MARASLKDALKKAPSPDDFVEGARDTSIQQAGYTASQPKTESRKKATFNLPLGLHRRLKIQAAVEGREMVDMVAEAVEAYLVEREGQSG